MRDGEKAVKENELSVPQLVSYIKAIGYAKTSLQRDAMIEIALASVEGRSPNDEARKILDYSSKKTSDGYF